VIISNVKQGSDEWVKLRLSIPTASGFGNMLTPSTLKPSASSMPYMAKLLAQYITGEQEGKFSTPDTDRGTDMEPTAVKMYEAITGNFVEHIGLAYKDKKMDRSASPDGLIVGDILPDGGFPDFQKGLEIKCPQLKTHIGYVLKGVLPNDYKLQVHGCMYVTNLDEWDFISFHPEFRPLLLTIERDWDIDRAIHKELDKFCEKLADEKAKIDASREF